jgi:hypothetical protein
MRLGCVLLVLLIGLVFVMGQSRTEAGTSTGANVHQIALAQLNGTFAEMSKGSMVLCFDRNSGLQVSCSTTGALTVPFSVVSVGSVTQEANSRCGSFTQTYSRVPVSANPPSVTTCQIATQTTNYDPSTGTGDCSFTTYIGATCAGAAISGRTAIRTGTCHFVASQGGAHLEFVITSLSGAGDFSFSGTDSRE